jgi:hypothetical protein
MQRAASRSSFPFLVVYLGEGEHCFAAGIFGLDQADELSWQKDWRPSQVAASYFECYLLAHSCPGRVRRTSAVGEPTPHSKAHPLVNRPEHVGVNVAGKVLTAVAVADELQRAQHGAAVIPVTVREDDRLDRLQICAEPRNILFECAILRPCVEEQRFCGAALTNRDQTGEAEGSAAQAFAPR